jgi:CRISPR-associated exonuclease Cas4
LEVYSEKYGLVGKIDLYDRAEKTLIERKSKISFLHQGYTFQLYAQYFALEEMGFPVERLLLRSLVDNKRYEVPLPTGENLIRFEQTLTAMKNCSIEQAPLETNLKKCARCIYRPLCRPEIIVDDTTPIS